ncbi:MAG TPA: FAD-dependent 5-carboxymethylaminomethyl-2-thiouridine(34) oxidoreductase MnmC [Macromonas sp.]|nr:FAD-dependent 5-carboxymethylaminomethyl-2-thiouridine(34) oxidoreductase MnmC [Macromonas sp.]
MSAQPAPPAASPVEWTADGTPRSTRFDDRYRSTDGPGGWAQARQVFLAGCGLLPTDGTASAWADQPSWQILETGFGLGLNFLAAWHAWRADPQRPQRLLFTSIEAWPVSADDIRRSAQPFPELHDLAETLARQWQGLLPGTHRLVFEAGWVQLTLCIGLAHEVLPTLDSVADSVFLDGFTPASNPEMWDGNVLKAVGRLVRPGSRLATWTVAREVRDGLASAGFVVEKALGLPPKRDRLQAIYAPRWTPRHSQRTAQTAAPGRVLVVGAGLAGSAVAWSLAQRGWQVEVLDQAPHPAAGASALPAGIVAPHTSPDDALLSRISRAGARLTLQRAAQLLRQGVDWAPSGVLEHRVEGKHALPDTELWARHGVDWSRAASAEEMRAAHLGADTPGLWHGLAGWMRPAQLVQAQLQHPNIHWRGACEVHSLTRHGNTWRLLDAHGKLLNEAEHVVLATAFQTRSLLREAGLPTVPLNALRGQVSWGRVADLPQQAQACLPPQPVNGHGSFLHGMPGPEGSAMAGTPVWVVGSTFERGATQADIKPSDRQANQTKLERLLPALAPRMADALAHADMWAGVRCTLSDRLPAVGPLDKQAAPGLYVCAGLGARGLTLSVLCGEVLAAWLHGEPWPAERKLAHALLAERFAAVSGRHQSP